MTAAAEDWRSRLEVPGGRRLGSAGFKRSWVYRKGAMALDVGFLKRGTIPGSERSDLVLLCRVERI